MKSNRVVIPNINLKKFYRTCAFKDVVPESIELRDKSFVKYTKLREMIFEGVIKAETYSIFIDKLREKILQKIISKEDLKTLINKPLNPITIKSIFQKKKKEISDSSAKAFLSLLIKTHLLDQVNIIKIIDLNDEVEKDKDQIFYYILRRRDFLSLKNLKEKFWDHPRKHKINDYLLELWIQRKIDIKGLDVPRELCTNYDFNSLPPEKFTQFGSIETFRERETGELKSRIFLNDDYKIYPSIRG